MLEDGLAYGTAADHPLQSQLLVKQLGTEAGVTEYEVPPLPVPPLETCQGKMQLEGSGLVQQEPGRRRGLSDITRLIMAKPSLGPRITQVSPLACLKPFWASHFQTQRPGEQV